MDKLFVYRLVLYIAEWLAAFSGLLNWKRLPALYWKIFTVYLFVIALAETCSEIHFFYTGDSVVNTSLYTYFVIPVQFLFFFWMFYRNFKGGTYAKTPAACAAVYITGWITDHFFLSGKLFVFLSFSYTVGNILLLILVLLFFIQMVKGAGILTFYEDRMFWVCCGLIMFYLGSLPFFGLWNTLAYKYPGLFNQYWVVQMFLNYGMYLFFIIALLWRKVR